VHARTWTYLGYRSDRPCDRKGNIMQSSVASANEYFKASRKEMNADKKPTQSQRYL